MPLFMGTAVSSHEGDVRCGRRRTYITDYICLMVAADAEQAERKLRQRISGTQTVKDIVENPTLEQIAAVLGDGAQLLTTKAGPTRDRLVGRVRKEKT